MKNKTNAIVILSAASLLATAGIIFNNNNTSLTQTMGANGYARQMVFTSLYRNVVTSNGNTFSAFWVEQLGESSFSNGLATLTGTASWSSSAGKYNSYSSVLGIKGDYNISNISSIQITFSIKSTRTELIFGTLTENNEFDYTESVGVTLSLPYENTQTVTIDQAFDSVYGIGFTLVHDKVGGSSNKETMTATIEKVIINYTC